MGNNPVFRFWINHSMRNLHVALGVAAVTLQVIGRLSGNPKLLVIGDMVTLIAIFHYFIHGYLYRQQRFVTDNQRVYSLSKKKIARMGAAYLAAFLAALTVGMAVVREIYSGTLLAKLQAMATFLLGSLLGAVFESDGLGRDELLLQDNTDLFGVMDQFSRKTDSPWESLINSIQTVLIIAGVALLLVLCVAVAAAYVRRLFGKARLQADRRQGFETADREEKIRGKKAGRERILDFSPTSKIRRIYRRCINSKRRRGQTVQEWMTPAEIENMVLPPEEEKYRTLHTSYEKARYSEKGCTEEDVQRIKALKI